MAEISKTPKKGLSLPEHYDPSMEKLRNNMELIDSLLQKSNPNDLTDINDSNGEYNLNTLTTTGRYLVRSGATGNPSGNAGVVDVFRIGNYILQEYRSVVNATYTYRRYSANSGSFWNGWIKDWNANNDGFNSGLDADMLEGLHGSDYIRRYGNNVSDFNDLINIGFHYLSGDMSNSPDPSDVCAWGCIVLYGGSINYCQIATKDGDSGGVLYMRKGNTTNWTAWEKIWTSGIDGTGSGLDADLLDGKHSNEISIETVSGGSSSENHTVLLNMGEEESQLGDGKFYYVDSGYFKLIQDESCPVYHAPALVCLSRLDGSPKYRVIVLYSGSIISGMIDTSYNFMSSEPVYINALNAIKLGDYSASEYVRKTEFNILLNKYSLQCVSGSKSPFIVDSLFDSIGSGKYVFINDGTYKFYSSGDEYNAPALISLNYLTYSAGKFVATVFNALNTVTYIVDLAESTTTISTTSINAEKLDGLSGDKYVTISNLLTKIRAIDGSGSDIDADLLDGFHVSGLSKYGDVTGSLPTSTPPSVTSGFSAMYRFCDSNNLIGEGSSVYYGVMQIYYSSSYYALIAVSMSSGKVYRQTSGTTAWNEITPKIPVLSADPASPSDGQMWIRSDL